MGNSASKGARQETVHAITSVLNLTKDQIVALKMALVSSKKQTHLSSEHAFCTKSHVIAALDTIHGTELQHKILQCLFELEDQSHNDQVPILSYLSALVPLACDCSTFRDMATFAMDTLMVDVLVTSQHDPPIVTSHVLLKDDTIMSDEAIVKNVLMMALDTWISSEKKNDKDKGIAPHHAKTPLKHILMICTAMNRTVSYFGEAMPLSLEIVTQVVTEICQSLETETETTEPEMCPLKTPEEKRATLILPMSHYTPDTITAAVMQHPLVVDYFV